MRYICTIVFSLSLLIFAMAGRGMAQDQGTDPGTTGMNPLPPDTGSIPGLAPRGLEVREALERKIEELRVLEEKVMGLEKRIGEAEQVTVKMRDQEAKLKEEKKTPLIAYYKDDFWLETPDKEFQFRIRGNIHFDTRFFDGGSSAPNSFDIRQARYDLQGYLFKYYSFRLQAELADAPYLRNAWVDVGYVPWLHIQFGQMKPPFSTEWWTLDNRVNFVERATSNPLNPFFDRGFWFWGYLFKETLVWNASVWTGAGLDLDTKKGDIDDHKDFVARLFWTPFKNSGNKNLKELHLVIQGTHGEQSVPTERFESGLRAPNNNSDYWKWTDKTMFLGSRDRYGAELHWIRGPFLLSSEYIGLVYKDMDDKEGLFSDKEGKVTNLSVWTSYFLTGEKKEVSNFGWKDPKPAKNFDPRKGTWGAWEILARYSHTETDQTFFNLGILNGASTADEYTLGVNWTLNPMVRIQLNDVYIDANGLLSGSNSDQWDSSVKGKKRDNENAVLLRLIFKI
jgi:phosphate-selective porin OprO/OprP